MSSYKEIKKRKIIVNFSEFPEGETLSTLRFYCSFPICDKGILLKMLSRAYRKGFHVGQMKAWAKHVEAK